MSYEYETASSSEYIAAIHRQISHLIESMDIALSKAGIVVVTQGSIGSDPVIVRGAVTKESVVCILDLVGPLTYTKWRRSSPASFRIKTT